MRGPSAPAPARLKRRAEFLAVAKGRRCHETAFTLQAARREGEATGPRFGLTATRKSGGAVERNRMRRRLREALRRIAPDAARPDHDYVVVLRPAALTEGFDQLLAALDRALRRIHAPRPARGAAEGGGRAASPGRNSDASRVAKS